jgi:uncharacterized protein YpuA (DUF1002 family)
MVSRNKKNNNKTISNHLLYDAIDIIDTINNMYNINDTDYPINDIVNILCNLKNDKNIKKLSHKKVTWSIYTLIYPI